MDNLEYNYDDYNNVTLNPDVPVDGYGPGRLPEDIVALTIFLVVFLLGVPGNSLVVWVTAFEARQTINAIWFLNLAMADLLSCLALPILFYSVLQDNTWPLGNDACRILPSLILLNLFASILLLAAISADRFLLVFNPIWCQKFRGSHLAWAACGVAWVLALLLTIPSFMYRQEHYDPYAKKYSCGVNYGHHGLRTERAVAIVRLIVGFVLPLLTLSICYTFLLLRTWSRKATRSTKTVKVVLAVVISFFVFWLPYQVTGTIMAVLPRSSPIFSQVQRLDSLCVSLAYINCCINPIIYVLAGKSFHGRLRRSLPSIIKNVLTEDSVGRESKTFTRSTVDSAVSKSQAV